MLQVSGLQTGRISILFGLFLLWATTPYPVVASDIIGVIQTHVVVGDETFIDLARRYKLGYVELVAANPMIDPWVPKEGQEITLPTAHILPTAPRKGIIVNLSTLRIYYFPRDGGEIQTWPIGVGRLGLSTPIGRTNVVRKRTNPTWVPTKEARLNNPNLPAAVPPGPNNPLGRFALDLGWPTYLIHGTNKPAGVGRRVSRGCIRMYPEDIEVLFERATIGTVVTVVDEPAKLGWHDGELFLEVHVTKDEIDQIEEEGEFTVTPLPGIRQRVRETAGAELDRIDWAAVKGAVAERRGYPVRVTR